jgi:tRNA-Thr(GGU) m(6)t(6)A37 methyltransferase TsaA
MSKTFTVRAIGRVRNSRDEPVDDGWDGVESVIDLDAARFGPEALAGLDGFSHVEVLFVFDRVSEDAVHTGARHPRGRHDWPKVGIFAQRGKDRPNRLGLCVCPLLKVAGTALTVRGLDAIDGTPVLDIKPYIPMFDRIEAPRVPAWVDAIMDGYF